MEIIIRSVQFSQSFFYVTQSEASRGCYGARTVQDIIHTYTHTYSKELDCPNEAAFT